MKSISGFSSLPSSQNCCFLHSACRYSERSKFQASSCAEFIKYYKSKQRGKWKGKGGYWVIIGSTVIIQIGGMGIEGSEIAPTWIHSRYLPVDIARFEEYGHVCVFKKKEENYDYIARLDRMVQKDFLKEIQRELCFLTGKRVSLPFLKVFEVVVGEIPLTDSLRKGMNGERQKQAKGMCSFQQQSQTLSIYIQLLTYTLKEFIEYKKQYKHQITIKEYSYIIKTAISAAQLFQQWRLTYLEMDLLSELFYIKPNGQIKILPFRSRFLREQTSHCDCFPSAQENHSVKRSRNDTHHGVYLNLKKKESKHLKQIKELSLELFSTINTKVSHHVRTFARINRDFLLSSQDLELFKAIQAQIIEAKSLSSMMESLRNIEDDFLPVCKPDDSISQIKNPEVHLKQEEVHKSASIRKIIDFDSLSDSMSNTLSNQQPARRQSYPHAILQFPTFPSFTHFR